MFEAVNDALACAARIQSELKTRNDDLPDERTVQFRIGVNLGDVIEDRGDIYGDGVNVAARLYLIASYGQLDMVDDAEWELDELRVVRPNYSVSVAREEVLYKRPEDTERFIEGLSKAGLQQ